MELLVRIHVERQGFLWEILEGDESLHLATAHVKAEETARRQADRYIQSHGKALRSYWAGLKPAPEGPFTITYETTSEFAV